MRLALFLSLALSLIVFLSFIFLSVRMKKKEERPFNFRQYFLYEAFELEKRNANFLRVLEIILIVINLFASCALFFMDHDETLISKYYFLVIVGVETLLEIVLLFLSITPLSKEKMHLFLFFAFGALIAIRNASAGRIFISATKKTLDGVGFDLTFAILSFVLAFLALAPLVNPKLSNYVNLVPTTNKDGTVSYERPKYFVMAFSEWLLFILNELSFIAICLFSCFIK